MKKIQDMISEMSKETIFKTSLTLITELEVLKMKHSSLMNAIEKVNPEIFDEANKIQAEKIEKGETKNTADMLMHYLDPENLRSMK